MTIWGADVLAANKYKKLAIKNVEAGFAIGVIWQVDGFGKAKRFIKRAVKSGKFPVIKINGQWSDTHTFPKAADKKAIQIGKQIMQLIAEIDPDRKIRWQYAPFLESREKSLRMVPLFGDLRSFMHGVDLINTAIGGGETVSMQGVINELHHLDLPSGPWGRYQFSFDGLHCVDADVEWFKKKYKDAEVFFFWFKQCNRLMNEDDETKRPNRKVKPTAKYIKSVCALANDKVIDTIHKDWLVKSHAEQKHVVDSRAGKVVVLGPAKNAIVKLGTETLIDTGSRHENDYIYRSNKFGFEFSSNNVELKVNGISKGRCDPRFRSGKSFRNKE